MMKLVERADINTEKWDRVIAASPLENVFQYSWYLDAVSPKWAALIADNYETILPVPYTKKMRVKQFIQAPFTREYTILGNAFDWKNALELLAADFKGIHFRNEAKGLVSDGKKRQHQWLDLKSDFKKNYSTNAKRLLKKADGFTFAVADDPKVLLELFKEHVAHKIDTISAADLLSLEQLMKNALAQKKGELLLVLQQGNLVAGGFFLLDKTRVTYLKGASIETAKKEGAMYYLIDQALQRYAADFSTFDFGGSDVDKVAEFYHKFGAQDRTYYDYVIDDLPFWFKTLKKLKR